MSLFTASLNSGSNGNCYYVGNEEDAVLIDAGISCRETEIRLNRLGLDIQKIKAIFISHEHTDHIKGLCRLAGKYQLPVYITQQTLEESRLALDQNLIRSFRPHTPILIGDLEVIAFPKLHDAADPHSFVISYANVRIGVFTDIGAVCSQVLHHFKTCHAVFLESNYDEEMLENGHYPYALKKRIRGGHGHISNREAFTLFSDHRPSFMTHLFLSHLSQENNSPSLVEQLFKTIAGSTEIAVASRFVETVLYCIQVATSPQIKQPNSFVFPPISVRKPIKKGKGVKDPFQLSLF